MASPSSLPSLQLLVSALVAVLALLPASCRADLALSGTGITGRYWDCCKPSCGWKDKAKFNQPVRACDAQGAPFSNFSAGSGCEGGTAFTCPNQSPWAVNDTYSYGFVGTFLVGGGLEDRWCCACYELTFQDDRLKGKTIVVQASNTDYDTPTDNMFTFAIPGGNNSFSHCSQQWGIPAESWGSNKTGVDQRSDCDVLPENQRSGCQWRFDWLLNIDRPRVNWKRVACPAAIVNVTGCVRDDDSALNVSTKKNAAAAVGAPATAGLVASLMTVAAVVGLITL